VQKLGHITVGRSGPQRHVHSHIEVEPACRQATSSSLSWQRLRPDLIDNPYSHRDGTELRGEDQAHPPGEPSNANYGAHDSAVCKPTFSLVVQAQLGGQWSGG
jgi:hypothetical protein